MWNRIIGKSSDVTNEESSTRNRRNGDESRSTRPRSSSTIVSSNSNKKNPSRGDDRDRGFNPTSTSYSTTSRSPYPGTASASIASSYATASGKNDDEQYVPPSLERNASLAEQMPKSKSSRSGRDQDRDQDYRSERRRGERKDGQKNNRDRGDQRRDLKDKSDKNDTDRVKERGLSRSASGVDEGVESSRGPADFPNQVGSAGFSQFPGQYDGGIPGAVPGDIPGPSNGTVHPAMSSHIQDQFPGQFPVQSAAPYRPPIAASEGGPGLAAEYYGDAGESVAEQPGFRKHSPSLIIGAEPHLLPASAVANPPPEPSASGGVGAAASFFNGSFDESEAESTHAQPASSTYGTATSRPDNSHHSASAPVIPTIGGAAMGAAAGYVIGGHTSSHQPRPDQAQSGGGAQSEYTGSTFQQSSSQVENSYYSEETRPSKPGAAGAAGLAAAAYHQAHQSSSQHNSSTSQYPATPMAQRHRHHGPLDAVVDFFRDPDGVAQFEEYSEIIGVCKYCFAPGSSPRDAPRKHYYRRRRSNERLGSSMRVDKDNRYYSSENERQRRKDKSWLASGLAGYGLGKMGETLFKQENDFDDTYSVKIGRQSPEGRSHKPRRRSRSKESVEIGITSDDRIPRKDPHGGVFSSPTTMTYTDRRHSRPKSPERKSSRTEAALGAAIGASMAGSTSRRRSHSPKGAWVKNVRKTREHSPERRRKSHKEKKERGFFSFINGSSSSSSLDLTYSGNQERRSNRKNTKSKPNDDKKAEAALLGLGAAAAALALNNSRQGHKKKGVKELVGVKESRDKNDHGLKHDRRLRASSVPEEDEAWESAPEDDQESINSDLAYGAHGHARRGSRGSLSSESSGTDKWGWRWGSKKKHRDSPPSQKLSDHSTIPAMSGAAAAGLAAASIMSPDPLVAIAMDSTSSLPLQKVYPVATSDPSRFDIGREGPLGSSSRPGIVPIQHPQPVTPVSSAIYSSQAPYEHSYSAPTGPPVFSQLPLQQRPPAVPVRLNQPDFSIPGGFPQGSSQAKDDTEDFKLRRRVTSPARSNAEPVESGMTPARRPSAKDDISAVRFDLTEEQEDRDRSERRQRRKEDRQRRAAEEQEQIDKERGAAMDTSRVIDAKTDDQERPEQSSGKSWAVPAAAAGVVGAAIGAAVVEVSKSDETREERKARRRRERELEEAADEEADRRRRHERRRRERELERQKSANKESQRKPDDLNEVHRDVDREEQPSTKEKSVPQRAASPRRSSTHEDYGAFFVPSELLERSNDKVKITSAGADADVDLERSSRVVTAPKGEREPVFSPADTDDKIDASRSSFPWFVPRLRLVEPTPPSSRGATPILRPKDASDDDIEEPPSIEELPDVEEPAKPVSTPRVTWGDAQTVEYTVITPHDEREEFIQSAPEQRREIDQSSARDETVSPHNRQSPPNGDATGNNSSSFSNDIEFAATLAATAEDAGFDPSIVINDPKYRRRESPPGSNERSMPGEFRDDDELPLSGKEPKKRTRANGRDDDAVVQDILNQVEYIEPEASLSDPVEEVEDRESSRKSRSKMTKKSRENRGSRDESYESPQSTGGSRASSSRDFYESPTEDAQSTVSSVSGNKNVENSKKSRSRSVQDSSGFDDAASTLESSNDAASKSKEKSKRNLWSRVLGKPADSPLQENGSKDVKSEALAEEIDETKKKSQRSKKRRSTRDEADDYDVTSKSRGMSERSRRRQSSETSTARESGRITQDVPAKVYTPAPYGHTVREEMLTESKERESSRSTTIPDAGSVAQYLDLDDQPEQDNAQISESFLGMRPQPPPTPSIPNKEKEPPDPTVIDLAASPPSLPDDHTQRVSVPIPPSPLQYPAALPSPTAVPITFRRPALSGAPRSRSQTPLSSTQSAPDISPRNKPRPRSTEFRGSKDMRPLWLVERHNSHQEQGDEETYPPLPSSHSTSRASSVHDSEEHNRFQISDYEIGEGGHEALGEAGGLMIETQDKAKELDLLDSQQATPTAAFFEDPLVERRSPSPARGSHGPPMQENRRQSSSILEDAALGAVFAGSAAYALHGAGHHEDLSRQRLSEEENEQLQQDLDDKAPASDPRRLYEDDRSSIQEVPRSKGEQSQQDSSDVLRFADTVPQQHHEDPLPQDFAPQRSTDIAKIKLEGSENPDPIIGMDAVPHVESTELESLNHEDGRQIPEQASRDAVTSSKKDQKNEDGAFVEKEQRVSEPGEVRGLLEDHVEPMEILDSRKEEVLTKEMPRNQVIGMMTTIAQDQNLDLSETDNGLEERQIKSESNDDGKGERNPLLTHDLPSSATTIDFIDPFVDQKSENVPQNPQVEVAAKEVQKRTIEKKLVPNPPVVDISPEGTPLPLDDDLDLLDALPPSPISQEGNQEFEPEADNAEFLHKLLPREELRFSEQSASSRNDVQNLEGTADGALASLSENDKTVNPDPSTIIKMQEDSAFSSAVPTGNADSTGQIGNLEGNNLVDPSVEELSAAEHQWPSVSGEKKDKQSKKSEQISGDDSKSANEAEAEERTELPAAVPDELDDNKLNNPDSNAVADAPPEGSRGIEDDWASFSTKKQGKKGRKKKSKIIDLEPGAFEKDQVEPQASTQELTDEPVPTATTTTAQEVSEMLDKAEDIGSVQSDADKLSTNEAMQDIQESEAKSPSRDNLALAEEKTATQQAHRLEINEAINTTQSDAEKEAAPVIESSAATIGTAKGVQDVLEEEHISLSRPAPQDEAEVIPVATEDPSPSKDQIKEIDEPEGDVLKDERGSQARKSERFLDETGYTDSTQSSAPPVEVEPPLALELKTGIAESLSGKKSKKDKKSKKQSRSLPARDRQDDISPDFTTIDSSQEIEQNAKLSNTSFPTSAQDTLPESVVEPTGPRESTPSADSKDISDVELPKEQDIPQTRTKKEKRKSKKGKAFIWGEDATSDPGYDRSPGARTPSGNAPTSAADSVGGESLETPGPAESSPPDGQRDISEVVLSQEPQIPVPKNRKGKKKSKKDKAFSWNEDSAPTPGDEPTVEASEFNEDILENTADTTYRERPASTGAAEPTPSTGSKEISEAELPRGSDMALPKNKKDKKKSKKSKRFSWEDEETPTPVDDADAEDKHPVEQTPEHPTPPGDAIMAESETLSESRPKSKKDRKKAKRAQALPWEGEEAPSLTKEIIQDQVETVDQAPAAESNRDVPITVHGSSPIGSRSESPLQQPIQNMSMDAPLEEAQREPPAPAPTEQNSIASLDSAVRQMGDLEDHIGDAHPSSNIKQGSEEDKQEGNEARASSLSAELQPHSEEISEESAAKGDSNAPMIIQLPEDPQMWSKQEQLTEQIEPTEVVASDETPGSRDLRGENLEGDSSAQTSDVGALEGAGNLADLPVEKMSVEPEEDRPLPKAAEIPRLSSLETAQDDGTSLEGRPQEAMRAFEETKATQSTGVATSPASEQEDPSYIPATEGIGNAVVEDEPWGISAVKEEKGKSQSTGPLISQNESENVEAASLATRDLSVASREDSRQRTSITNAESTPSTNLANSEVAVETSVPQESPHNPEEHREAASQAAEPSHSQEKEVPNPVEEFEMLYAEDEFNHDNERPSSHEMQEIVLPHSASDGPPTPVSEVEMMYAEDEFDHDKERPHNHEMQEIALPHSATEGPPTPAAEVGMMYAHDDRNSDKEQSREQAMQRQQAPPSELESSTAHRKTPDSQEVQERDDGDAKQHELYEIEHPLNQSNDPLTPTTEAEALSPQKLQDHDKEDMQEHELQDVPHLENFSNDLPARTTEVGTLAPPELQEDEQNYMQEREWQAKRLSQTSTDGLSTHLPESEITNTTELPRSEGHLMNEHEKQNTERPQSPVTDLPTDLPTQTHLAESDITDTAELPLSEEHLMYAREKQDPEHPQSPTLDLPTTDLPTPAAEVQLLDPQEQRAYEEDYAKELQRFSQPSTDGLSTHLPESEITHTTELPLSEEHLMYEHEKQDPERPQSPTSDLPTDLPTPIAEVQMLDPQEQRRYEEEYAKELQRQLSPAQNEQRADVPSDEVSAPLMPASSVGMIMEPPYDDIQRPLAQAPALEDIIEEPASRSGSVQENPAPPARDDQFPFKPTKSKKGKKGKKGKKQEQTIIWEDETATPPIEDETDRLVEPPTRSANTPSSFENEELQQPIDLEEPIERRPVEQLVEADFTSPTRDLSSYRASPKEHGEAGDYFSIQSTKGAEKDVGMDTTVVRDDSSSAELSRVVEEETPVREPSSLAQDERNLREYRLHDEDDIPELEHAAFDERSKVESMSADARADVNPSVAHSRRSSNNSMRSKRSLGLFTPELEQAAFDERSKVESTFTDARADVNPSAAHSRKSSNNSMRSKRSLGLLRTDDEPEPSPSNRPLDERMVQPIRPNVSSLDSFSEMRTSRESSMATDNRSQTRSTLVEGLTTAAGLGIGAVAAGGLSRMVSKKEVERDKSRSRLENVEEGPRGSESPISRAESVMESRECGPTIEQQTSTISQQGSLRTPSASPPPPTRYEPITREPDSRQAAQTFDTFNVRDSGYVADSPITSDEVPVHRSIRDSGYPETEASPIIDVESHIQEAPSLEEIQEDYGSLPAHLPVQYDHEYQSEEPRGSLPEVLPTLPLEASPVPDALISKPKERRRRRRSGASYDSDDSNDSGFDIQRRRRKQAMMDDVREPSPVSSTTKERSSELFGSSPSARQERVEQPAEHDHTSSHSKQVREEPTWSFGREVSPSPQGRSRDASGETESTNPLDKAIDSPAYHKLTGSLEEPTRSLFGGPVSHDEDAMSRSMSPLSTDGRGHGRLNTIAEETSPLPKDRRAMSDVGSSEAGVQEGRMRSPPADDDTRSYMSTEDRLSRQLGSARDEHSVDLERSRSRHTDLSSRHSTVSHASILPHKHADGEELNSSIASISSDKSIHAIIRTPDQVRSASGQSFRSSATPPLRRVDRSVSGDLRGASKRSEAKTRAKSSEEDAELDINIPSSSTYDPVTDKGKNRADMADVYEGWGDVRAGSPMSPTRPPSMRKRQSMQLLEYETRLDQLVSENRLLQTQKTTAERTLEDQARDHSQQRHAYEEALQEHKMFLAQKDSELNELKGVLEEWQSKVDHLTEVNEALNSRGLDEEHEEHYRQLEAEHTNLREQHTQLSTGMEEIVRHEVSVALEEKNLELRQLRDELENAKQQVRNLQQQLLVSRSSEDFIERDEDYFDGQCQSLCQHVQQWVLRFSKFSDMKACYHPSEIRDEKIVDRVENAILDGTDVDEYLQDRVKRRDVFMSVVMTMIWEFIFTRYLFGMDREQRQKLKNLEKTLQEVGPISAVHKWRATTLTLLMKRPSFESQRATDTEAVVQEIYDTLATFLPPPSHLVNQIQESLRKVINAAVDLSIEMRTQRAEYSMLPPLQPEYDTNGDLARKVYFSALTMNERSGQTSSNDALQEQRAVVRMVLFPLVVKNEDDDEQIVVCPAQVLVADGTRGKGKSVRVMSAQSAARSEASFAGTDAPREGGMI
ncbi:hypothetical protein JMJ35_002421 [Cladonia borealis]|uniref:Involucrin repeat protein n=1 Tax=Cladonia borealis TaxID=184061 RepID=A0AA39R536_9LECA|nr:hypothetical protein JMJ35_002421 [Cladonia borealis]